MQDPRDRVYDEHTVAEDMLEFLQAFLEGTASYCVVTMLGNVLASLHKLMTRHYSLMQQHRTVSATCS